MTDTTTQAELPDLPEPENKEESDGYTYACPEGFTADQMHAHYRKGSAAEAARWRTVLDAVMPPDFKDWHQNSCTELPSIAAWVITNARQQRDDAEQALASLTAERDELRARLQWRPISTAPKDGRKLLLSYRNRCGNARTVVGCWLTDEQAAETDADGVGLEGGWYEHIDNWDDYTQVAIRQGEPTHWKPLPEAPAGDARKEGD